MTTMTTMRNLVLFFGWTLGAGQAWAVLNCGDSVSGIVTLTNDIVCTDAGPGPILGLTVAADDTTINLNGHTISCSGGGFMGSCQSTSTYNGGTGAPVSVGIISSFKNVEIVGPGTVTGFNTDIRLSNGPGLLVTNVTVTGPPTPVFADNDRLFNVGIVIANTTCSASGEEDAAILRSNDISNTAQGIQLNNAQCVMVLRNNVHNNASRTNNTPGIVLIESSNSKLNMNFVHANGLNMPGSNPAGAIQIMNASTGNVLVDNTVVSNCTNGIAAFDGPPAPSGSTMGNTIVFNVARFNSAVDTLGGQCVVLIEDPFFDLATVNAGTNSWHTNNRCRTQGPGIPAGVCNPGE